MTNHTLRVLIADAGFGEYLLMKVLRKLLQHCLRHNTPYTRRTGPGGNWIAAAISVASTVNGLHATRLRSYATLPVPAGSCFSTIAGNPGYTRHVSCSRTAKYRLLYFPL